MKPLFRVGRQGLVVHHSCSLGSPGHVILFVRFVKVVSEVIIIVAPWRTVCWRKGLCDLSLATVIEVDGCAKVLEEGSNYFSTRLLPPLGVLRLFPLEYWEDVSEWVTAQVMQDKNIITPMKFLVCSLTLSTLFCRISF